MQHGSMIAGVLHESTAMQVFPDHPGNPKYDAGPSTASEMLTQHQRVTSHRHAPLARLITTTTF